MKKVFLSLALCILCIYTSNAQRNGKQKLESAKVAILSTRLNLTEQQAVKFWPVYNQYLDDLKVIFQKRKAINDVLSSASTASDADLDKALSNLITSQQEELDLRKRYKTEFLKVINVRQLAELMKAEKDFKEMLIKRMADRSEAGGPRRGRIMGR